MQIIETSMLALMSGNQENDNMASIVAGLEARGHDNGLDLPHRLACYLAQTEHESGGYRYDREVWGPTPAQQRYDVRTDIGNTPERDGDGFLFRGRTGIQITGRANTVAFREWCRSIFGVEAVPDFETDPDAMLTDPWEGLGPIWYWETRGLNRYADEGDMEMITRRINGGLNGYADRLRRYDRCALVLLGLEPDDIRAFQAAAGLVVDGISGPRTRAAMHTELKALPPRGREAVSAPDTDPRSAVAIDVVARISAIIEDFHNSSN